MAKLRVGTAILLGLAFVPLLIAGYLLSIGPAILLREAGLISPVTVSRVYAPVGWLEGRSPVFQDGLWRYIKLWVP